VRVVLRADASTSIGTGHVMRCLTLARALQDVGAQILFVSRDHAGNLNDHLAEQAIAVARLPIAANARLPGAAALQANARALGASWEEDADATTRAVARWGTADWLVVDHYGLDCRWEAAVRPLTRHLMVVDDLADRQHECDLLLDQNDYPDRGRRYDLLAPSSSKKLLGPEYALLRPEFVLHRAKMRVRAGTVRRILIFFGGSNPNNETKKAIDAFLHLGRADIDVDVVVGEANAHRTEIERACAAHTNLHYFCQISNMAQLMAAADLAVGGGGVALLERCAMYLPAIVLSLADNQLPGCQALARRGGAVYVGEASATSAAQIAAALAVALRAPDLLHHMAQQAGQVTDGRGTSRVVAHMHRQPLALRPATADDCESVWRWRNDVAVRQFATNPAPIDLPRHRQWYAAVLNDPSRALLIGENSQGPVGVLRYDIVGQSATISVFVVPGRQGAGLGTELIQEGEAWLRERRPEVTQVRAEIGPQNESSIRAFTRAGFVVDRLVYVREVRRG